MLGLLTILLCLYVYIMVWKDKKGIDFLKLKHRDVHFLQLSVHCTTLGVPVVTGAVRQDHGMWQRLGSRFLPSMKNSSPQWIHT